MAVAAVGRIPADALGRVLDRHVRSADFRILQDDPAQEHIGRGGAWEVAQRLATASVFRSAESAARRMHAIRTGETKTVSFSLADGVLSALDEVGLWFTDEVFAPAYAALDGGDVLGEGESIAAHDDKPVPMSTNVNNYCLEVV